VRDVSHVLPVFVSIVVEARVKFTVEEATREKGEPVRARSVEVALVVCPYTETCVKGSSPAPPEGHVVLQMSPVKQIVVAEKAVEDA
jgi:hypothetical protein